MVKKFVKYILLVVAMASFGIVQAQESFKELFNDAEYYFFLKDYKEALPLYNKLYSLDSANSNIIYKIGLCYLNIPGLKEKAIPYLEKASQNISKWYREGYYREKNAPLDVLFYLGQAYEVNFQFDKALEAYKKFKEKIEVRDIFSLDYVNQQIKACEIANDYISRPITLKTEHLNLFKNTRKSCTYPVVSGDRQTMVFTVKEKFYTAVYYTKCVDGKWETPKNVTLDLRVEGELYTTSLNYSGDYLIIFVNEITSGNLYYSTIKDGKWQPVKKLPSPINSRDWETFASLSPDGKQLYFTSNRKGGYGGIDIYVSNLMPNGKWSEPVNLGPQINTAYNEESPILCPNGKTLYFASQGHNSMGGFDIFYSSKIGDGAWSVPTNVGYPFNTPDDEYFFFPVDSLTGYMPMVVENQSSIYEIYKVSIYPSIAKKIKLFGNVKLSDNADVKSDSITILVKDTSNNTVAMALPLNDGSYSVDIKPGTYKIFASSEFYIMDTLMLNIPLTYNQEKYPLDLNLRAKPTTNEEVIKFNYILFDFNSYELKREALFELEKIYKLMIDYPDLYIEVIGHTDSKGAPAVNLLLSARRANAVVEYLVNKGIDEKRFVVRGMGSMVSFAANTNPDGSDNPHGRKLNRRVSIRVFNPNKNIKIEYVDIPEHLKPQNQKYTIMLSPINDTISPELVKRIEKFFDFRLREFKIGSRSITCMGVYETKADAIQDLNTIIDLGATRAMLINEDEMQRFITALQKNVITQKTVFTILVATSEIPLTQDFFRGLYVTEEVGDDGIYRYYYGLFDSKEKASKMLENVNSMGYPNAILVKLNKR
ncbi:OmpA family protein [Tenuifilum thalassicum]|uniref:OmpA family protein n=1 Tax=Tenuifilum thalassicum TaxID=2590900 RepID=A0A7D3XCW6_9BACT|nr:OmpA family protein [Tenuifilum thalassicum]QKG79352.1 OmpA family protein [Tenuifilum thalassicum]